MAVGRDGASGEDTACSHAIESRFVTMHECNYPPVLHIPRADVDMSLLERTTRSTY
jgi:uncharacterized protein (DUF427 family)